MLMEADMIRSGTAERIARLSDEAPGADTGGAGGGAGAGVRRRGWGRRPDRAAHRRRAPAALARAPPADPGSGAGSRRGAAPRAQLPLRRAGGGDALEEGGAALRRVLPLSL